MHLSVFCGHTFFLRQISFVSFFRNDPPGQTCSQAIQKLTEFTQNASSGSVPLEFVSQTKNLPVRDIDELQDLNQVEVLGQMLNNCTDTDIANFEQLVINTSYTCVQCFMYQKFFNRLVTQHILKEKTSCEGNVKLRLILWMHFVLWPKQLFHNIKIMKITNMYVYIYIYIYIYVLCTVGET